MEVKKLIKKIFPVVFLKRLFLYYNTAKIKTIDRLLFPEYFNSHSEIILNKIENPFTNLGINIDQIEDEEVRQYMQYWLSWSQEEFIVKPDVEVLIEPEYGWGFCGNKLNYSSLGFSRTLFQRKPDFFKRYLGPSVLKLDNAVSLRDTGEENYFHFYNDVLTKIFFLKKEGYDLGLYTFIISEKLWTKEYFQHFYGNSKLLQSLRWHIQKREFVSASACLFVKPMTHRRDLFLDLLSEINIREPQKERRVYLKRGKSRLRYVLNEEELEVFLEKMDFEIIDTDGMSLEMQIKLFSETRYLVAIHGAGITNIMFRGNRPMEILEIFAFTKERYLPFHYIMLAKMFGYNYHAIVGNEADARYSGGFLVDMNKLRKAMENIF